MINKNTHQIINKRKKVTFTALVLLLLALPAQAQYFGAEVKQRERVDIDVNAEHVNAARKAQEQEVKQIKKAEKHRVSVEFIERCDADLPPPSVEVTLIQENGFTVFNDKGVLQLSDEARASRSGIGANTYVFSSTLDQNQYAYRLSTSLFYEDRKGCIAPHVSVEIRQKKQEMEIAKEIAPKSCLETEVLKHEMRRVKINTDKALKTKEMIELALKEKMKDTPIFIGDEGEMERWSANFIQRNVEPIVRKIDKEQSLASLGAELDRLENSDYFLSICNQEGLGVLKKALQDAS